jgi:hypothetical protein
MTRTDRSRQLLAKVREDRAESTCAHAADDPAERDDAPAKVGNASALGGKTRAHVLNDKTGGYEAGDDDGGADA